MNVKSHKIAVCRSDCNLLLNEHRHFSVFYMTYACTQVNYVNLKMLLKENESYLVLMARQILLVTINNVYRY